MLGYVGLIWFADAMELMMLSFIGPAVSYGCTPSDTRFIPSACYVMYRSCGMSPPPPLPCTHEPRPALPPLLGPRRVPLGR